MKKIFQELDSKKQCYRYYSDGSFSKTLNSNPEYLTWKKNSSIDIDADYSWLKTENAEIASVCPNSVCAGFLEREKQMMAHFKAFEIAKIDRENNCFFDLIPPTLLAKYMESKNVITSYVWENINISNDYYQTLKRAHLLSEHISQYSMLVDEGWLNKNTNPIKNSKIKKIMRQKTRYDIFGTKTGRFTTKSGSFPILTLNKELRKAIKPKKGLFVSFDYNAAEIRTMLALLGHEQPKEDIHLVHAKLLNSDREAAKSSFFSWLYDTNKNNSRFDNLYDRNALLADFYKDGLVCTDFGRRIHSPPQKAFNYLLQSTANDMAVEAFYNLIKSGLLNNSEISFMIHDSIIIDIPRSESEKIFEIKNLIERTRYGTINCSVSLGKNLGSIERVI